MAARKAKAAGAKAPASYPDDNPKTAIGITKPGISAIPPVAILKLGEAMTDGKRKYGLTNWREKTVSASIYYDAAFRHLASWYDGEDLASDSLVDHLAHTMACCAILIDAIMMGKINDDRPSVPGKTSEYITTRAERNRR
jgi:hypothetical protein